MFWEMICDLYWAATLFKPHFEIALNLQEKPLWTDTKVEMCTFKRKNLSEVKKKKQHQKLGTLDGVML